MAEENVVKVVIDGVEGSVENIGGYRVRLRLSSLGNFDLTYQDIKSLQEIFEGFYPDVCQCGSRCTQCACGDQLDK